MKGGLNIYTCEKCRGHIVTRDRDEGVTPMFVGCRATPGCDGSMRSSMYRVFDQEMAEGFEWYKPSHAELAVASDHVQQHCSMGGLLIRKVSQPAPLPVATGRTEA